VDLTEEQVYARIGEDGFARLVRAFYAQVPGDAILGPMYPADDLAGAEARLRDFLVGRFGGPNRYIEQRGHPRLRMRHLPFAIDRAARDRWVELMDHALDTAAIEAPARALLREFLHGMATFMMNREQVRWFAGSPVRRFGFASSPDRQITRSSSDRKTAIWLSRSFGCFG
jgi:hemoglobin